jgi:hypothetical protein
LEWWRLGGREHGLGRLATAAAFFGGGGDGVVVLTAWQRSTGRLGAGRIEQQLFFFFFSADFFHLLLQQSKEDGDRWQVCFEFEHGLFNSMMATVDWGQIRVRADLQFLFLSSILYFFSSFLLFCSCSP